jgi:regulator of sigma E protease
MDRAMVGRVMDGSPLASLSIRPGTRIQKVAGTPVATFSDIRLALQNAAPGQVDFELVLPLAGGQVETASATLGADALASVGKLRWEAQNMPPLSPMLEMQRASNALEAVTIGIEKTHLFMLQTYITLARLVEGEVQVRNLRGPLGIAVEGTAITKRGGAYLMFFLGLISINLAVINFLPLPIVDGGLFVLLMIEKLRGKPVSPQIQSAITVAGLLLLGTIFLMVTYHDIGRLITGG